MLFTHEQKKKIKYYIIHNIILKIKKPRSVFLEELFCYFYNTYLKKHVTKYLCIFFKYYDPILKLKVATHLLIEPHFTEPGHKTSVHCLIAGFYNLIFSYHYLFWILILYFLKKKLFIYIKHNIVRVIKRPCITEQEILTCLKTNFKYSIKLKN
jgi:hypothetical protein